MSHESRAPTSIGNSYVYPVRSLFTGINAPVLSPPRLSASRGASFLDKRLSPADAAGAVDSGYTTQQADSISRKHIHFRHFPDESSDQRQSISLPLDPCPNGNPATQVVTGPMDEPVSHAPIDVAGDPDGHSSRPPEQVPGVATLTDSHTGSDSEFTRSSLASAGLVHLAPIRFDSQSTNRDISSQASTQGSDSLPSSAQPSNHPAERLVTYRFQHVQVGDIGHHIVIGYEGKLTKCEDEPIRAPGAVQGFGVLVALRQDEGAGTLVVRQVSENASGLLGLSPQYLFSLDCFTHILPDSQADVLWDNVQFLNDPELEDPDRHTEGPQIFLLSGWSEPVSAVDESDTAASDQQAGRRLWTCWCAAHKLSNRLIILEFELERDSYNPLYPPYQTNTTSGDSSHGISGSSGNTPGSSTVRATSAEDRGGSSNLSPAFIDEKSMMDSEANSQRGLQGDNAWIPSAEDILESTTSCSKPLRALERMRRVNRAPPATEGRRPGQYSARSSGIGTMDVFSVLAQVNDQLASASDLDTFLKIVVGVIKDLCQFHRVLVYQFDELWNGQVVAELVEWNQTHDLYKNLHFPASDIPAQARELYCLNKVRLLYDRSQTTARLVVRDRSDLDPPLDMTHSYLRAMSPIHIEYLGNMGVRASMSISIVAFGTLWGLIACHSYGDHGMRVSFPVRQILRQLSDSISRNIERLSYAQRLHTRKLISTLPTDSHPTGYIVSNAEDLLSLFDADFGVLVVGEGAKILGPNQHGQEVLILAEYLRLKQFELMQVSQAVTVDFPDLVLSTGLEAIAGLLYVPLSSGGKDFIALLRKGQLRDIHWGGKPFKGGVGADAVLEPRKSFKMWSETIVGRCRAWTDEQLETAGVLALVYGKFIEVWRQKETAVQTKQLTNLLLSNASHEVRTPLNHIINYLELALNGPLDGETRENLTQSHTASKSLLFTINDLLDLTRLESGGETSFSEPFDLQTTMEEAVDLYRIEATRRGLGFQMDIIDIPRFVIGDSKKIRTILGNLVANAIKYTSTGKITIDCHRFPEPSGLRTSQQVAVEILVADTGCGMSESKLESMFREFEQVESATPKTGGSPGLGLGLAVVARIIEQLGGQLRVDSKPNEGSRISFLIPFVMHDPSSIHSSSCASSISSHSQQSRQSSDGSGLSEIDSLVEALSTNHMVGIPKSDRSRPVRRKDGSFPVEGSKYPVRSVKVDEFELGKPYFKPTRVVERPGRRMDLLRAPTTSYGASLGKLRVLVVDDDAINRTILSKRLSLDGHEVMGSTNGQEGVQVIESDRAFDCILMDIQMPILDGFEATKKIRVIENTSLSIAPNCHVRHSLRLNGRIPIFAVSASLAEHQREDMCKLGLDGWILKPIDFKRLNTILRGIIDASERRSCLYYPGCNWEAGGWLSGPNLMHQSNLAPKVIK